MAGTDHVLVAALRDPATRFVVEVSGGCVTGVSFPAGGVQGFVVVDYDELEDTLETVEAVDAVLDLVHLHFPAARCG